MRRTLSLWQWLAWLALGLGWQVAQAAVDVSGTITSNTVWTAAQSPYVLQGDVVVDNNATLTIQPSVQVRMAPGASFTLRQGALQAVGTASNPIIITSDAATPAPGDWRQWRLTAGTRSAQTILEHVQMSYGAGLVVEGSAPVLNHLNLQNHSGPAISIDLAASPVGRNLHASGNALNAIAVPAGTIRGQVVWGLVGIPYLVQQGLVQVGQSPLSLEPTRLKLSPGVVAILRLAVSAPAPASGLALDMTSSVPSVATVASRATIAAGQYGADVEVTAHAVGSTAITASHAALGSAATFVDVVNLPALELVPSQPTIGVQRPYAMTVRAPQAAPVGGLPVTLGNSDSAVLRAPATVLIPAGQTSASFEVTGLADGTSRLSAQSEGLATGLSTVTVRGKALVLPSSIVVAPGAQTQSTVELTEPAPAGGLTVNLTTAASSTATVPASVNVPAGASRASFNVQGVALGATELTASANGYQGTKTPVQVDAISLELEPAGNVALSVEQALTRRVQLSKAAPAGGVTVKVSLDNTAFASVTPTQVQVPEGHVFGLMPLTIKGLEVGQTQLHLSSAGLIAKTVDVDVRQKQALQVVVTGNRSKVVVGKGLNTYIYEVYIQRLINGQATGGAQPLTVRLRCADERICKVPATVTIPANQGSTYVQVTGVELGSTQLHAEAEGATAASPVPVEVIAPQIQFHNLDGTRTPASMRDNFSLSLNVPGAYYANSQSAAQPMNIQLGLAQQNPAGVVNGIYTHSTAGELTTQALIAANATSTGALYVAQPAQPGTYRISAEIAGIASAQSEVQTVTAGTQALQLIAPGNRSKVVVGKGLNTYMYEMRIQRLINGQAAGGAQPLTVRLRCADERICKVPATVTIPANQGSMYVQVTGVELGSTQIEAQAEGVTAASMPVEVISPQIQFHSLDGTRTPASVRDNFSLSLNVPGAYYASHQYPDQPMQVQLRLAQQNPAGVVNGIYTHSTAGELTMQALIAANATSTGWLYVAQPAQPGTYRISAEIPGISSGLSEVQTVTVATQALQVAVTGNRSKVVVGKGLNTYIYEVYIQRLINGQATGGAQPLTVRLRCADERICKVPATVTLPANQSSTYVQVTGVELGSTQLHAEAEGATAASPVPVEVIAPQIQFHNLDGTRTLASVRDNFSLSLNVPGASYANSQSAAQPMQVQLRLTDQEPAGVVNGIYTHSTAGELTRQALIAANATSTGALYVAQPAQPGTYRISAEIAGIASAQSEVQTVQVARQALRLAQISDRPRVVAGKGMVSYASELRVQRLVNGEVASGADAVTVNLRCVARSVCTVPATVTIPAGGTEVAVPVTGVDVGSTQIEASASGFAQGGITVETVTPQLVFVGGLPNTLKVGQTYDWVRVQAQVPGASYSGNYIAAQTLSVTLTSAVPSVATVASPGTWRADSSSSDGVALMGVAPGTTSITASAPGFHPVTSGVITINP